MRDTEFDYQEQPEGWYYEEGDPSVGLFGGGWIHDACSEGGESEPEVTQIDRTPTGERNGEVCVRWRVRCPDCGETFVTVTYDWDGPDDDSA